MLHIHVSILGRAESGREFSKLTYFVRVRSGAGQAFRNLRGSATPATHNTGKIQTRRVSLTVLVFCNLRVAHVGGILCTRPTSRSNSGS